MKTVIYFVRHGKVENPKKLLYGQLAGFPLSGEGKKQAIKLAGFFTNQKIAAVFSSPLERAKETALPIAKKLHLPLKTSRLLIESNFADWQGKKLVEVGKTRDYQIYQKRPSQFLNGGESVYNVGERIALFCRNICQKFAGQKVIAVSHEDPIRAGRLYLLGHSLDRLHQIEIHKGEFLKFEFENGRLIKTSKPSSV